MATPFGFIPADDKNAASWTGQMTAYTLDSATTNSFYCGDLVKATAKSGTNPVLTGPQIEKYAAADFDNNRPPLGVFQSIKYTPANGSQNYSDQRYWVAGTPISPGTEVVALVYDDPALVMQVVCTAADGTASTAFTTDDLWKYAKPAVNATAANGVNNSNMSLDIVNASTPQVVSTTTKILPFMIIGLANMQGNNFGISGAVALVRFAFHQFRPVQIVTPS